MQKSIAAILFVVFAISISCDYQPDGEFSVILPKPDSTGMSIELTNLSTDTLFLFTSAQIYYKSIIGDREVRYFQAFINNESILTQPSESGSFSIYPASYGNGFYTLRIEINASSGTGSLAEARGQELLRVTKTYVLAIDISKPDPVEITSIARVDGTLELVWEKYRKFNFQRYKIFKYCYNQGFHYYEPHWIKEISSKEITSLRDSTFIGGKVMYVVSVIAAQQESDLVEKEFEDPYDLSIAWEWVDKTNIKFIWRKTPYYNCQ